MKNRGKKLGALGGYFTAAILGIVLALAAPGCAKWTGKDTAQPKVAIIGLDGATWEVADELIAQGKLPHLQSLIERGVRADLTSIEPLLSPLIWTSMVTGVGPEVHGITWFMVRDPNTGQPLPITSAKREVPALWNIASDAGKKVGFVGWWATWPAERVNGFMVSDQVAFHGFALGREKIDLAATHRTYPEALMFEIEPMIVAPLKQPKSEIDRYMNITPAEYDASAGQEFNFRNPLQHFMYMLATLKTYETVGLSLYKKEQPDLFGIFFESVDTTSHLYMKYRPPRLEGIREDLIAKYADTVNQVYQRNDEMLGKFLAELDENTIVLVVSDHGFKSETDRLKELENTDVAVAHKWHKTRGIFVMAGPGVKKATKLDRASILDIAPTVLYALGLPVAEDFAGKALTGAFEDRYVAKHPVTTVATYNDGSRKTGVTQAPPEMTAEMEAKLKSLGYIGGDETAEEKVAALDSIETYMNRLNFYRKKGDIASAAKIAEQMVQVDAEDPRAWAALADTLVHTGETERAMEAVTKAEDLVKAYQADPPKLPNGNPKYPPMGDDLMSVLRGTRAYLETQLGNMDAAAALFAEAKKLDADNVHAFYGYAYLMQLQDKADEAKAAYEETLERFPDHSFSLNNLGNIYFREGKLDKAIELYDRTAKVDPAHFECLHNKGMALLKLGRKDEAIAALRQSLERNSTFEPSLRHLGMIYVQDDRVAEALPLYETLAQLDPSRVGTQLQLAELYFQAGRMDDATKTWRTVRALDTEAAAKFTEAHPDFRPDADKTDP